MKYYKKIEGSRVYLSPMNVEDAEAYLTWLNDRKVSDNIHATSKIYNLPREVEWIENSLKNGDYTFSIILKEKDILIGNAGIHNIKNIDRAATLGIFIGDEEYRGKGIGTEVIMLLLDYGFNYLNLHSIDLDVFSFNKRAISCYKKVGFKECGVRHECYYLDGKYHDDIKMEILKSDFEKLKITSC
ncbi:MAG: GNAT family protein [Bacilli bacterium]|nr:GNAT family protein [Bacilli bacterium]